MGHTFLTILNFNCIFNNVTMLMLLRVVLRRKKKKSVNSIESKKSYWLCPNSRKEMYTLAVYFCRTFCKWVFPTVICSVTYFSLPRKTFAFSWHVCLVVDCIDYDKLITFHVPVLRYYDNLFTNMHVKINRL